MYTIESLRLNSPLEIAIVPSKKELFSRLCARRIVYSTDPDFSNEIPDRNLSKADVLDLGASLVASDVAKFEESSKKV